MKSASLTCPDPLTVDGVRFRLWGPDPCAAVRGWGQSRYVADCCCGDTLYAAFWWGPRTPLSRRRAQLRHVRTSLRAALAHHLREGHSR